MKLYLEEKKRSEDLAGMLQERVATKNSSKVWEGSVRRALKAKAPLRVQFLLTFGGRGL